VSPGGGRYREIMRRVRPWLIALGVVVLLGTGAYVLRVGSGNAQSKTSSPSGLDGRTPPVPVVATAARTSDVAVYLAGLGSVTPLNTVTVHTRVDGELTKVLFQEGRRVNAGDLLAEIDPRRHGENRSSSSACPAILRHHSISERAERV
jgi:membrane fusion protein, multidrug efflux system